MTQPIETFESLQLPEFLLEATNKLGYKTPSPIQAAAIPLLLENNDLIGQAQTGTGKTAAFALPLLAGLDFDKPQKPQALILAPTRELAIQVAEAFKQFATGLPRFRVAAIFGGDGYHQQIRSLKSHPQVVVGTPGRVMDHMRRGTLDVSELKTLVLDEADEMLRMGFIDDVEWVLEQTPDSHQTVLFSATMPAEIKRIANGYLKDPKEVIIKQKTQTAASIRQRVWMAGGVHKLDALTRILETEDCDGVIIFVRTKSSTEDIAERLQAKGYAANALNGDMPQQARLRTVNGLKSGKLDIIVATDVAARGLDVERINLVINFDIPHDTEAYVHRIGRTGRAGNKGDAILFASPRERRMLRAIERTTRQPIETMQLPSYKDINKKRVENFKARINKSLAEPQQLQEFETIVKELQAEQDADPVSIAAAIASIMHEGKPFTSKEEPVQFQRRSGQDERAPRSRAPQRGFSDRGASDRGSSHGGYGSEDRPKRKKHNDANMETWRLEVGYEHGVSPKHIVGAIANEANLESRHIGAIEISDAFSLVDLPAGMPREVLTDIRNARICGVPTRCSKFVTKKQGRAEAKVQKPFKKARRA